MSKLLYITAHPLSEENSVSQQVGKTFLETYTKKNRDVEVIKLDLFEENIPLLDADVLSAWGKLGAGESFDSLTNEQQSKLGRINELTDQFMDADRFVFVTPMWNFGFPPVLKAYIDTFAIAGKTFKYTETGPVGLLEGKKAVHIQATGGIYSEGPAAGANFGDSHLKTVLGFVGVTDVTSIIAEGIAMGPEKAAESKEAAIKDAQQLAANLDKKGLLKRIFS
ncbi:FMN-dependent NADH-azoreductase [Chengkuizengella axinellae]|uniref:FMN dependent NADH:quinone oxidoreductase n=1 Tax=Chengkuizengella axinellae TaxID=3064388 RepID=A0ABT9IUI0_9BACL|nr:FMN-dependent NADH-azoreductase [Chengkuizengella sp. 2205SS18-9]MDP5272988.1 FMN-dependent NADH-azoreductase [Chengkuizengella sp. 2205SS18-9]